MTANKDFFDNLNRNIRNARTKKTLTVLEKLARKYVNQMTPSISVNIRNDAKKRLTLSLKLIRKIWKRLK